MESIYVPCWLRPRGTIFITRLNRKTGTFQAISKQVKNRCFKKPVSIRIASSDVFVGDFSCNVYEAICQEVLPGNVMKDVIIIDTESNIPKEANLDSVWASVLAKFMAERIVKKVIAENVELAEVFHIDYKKRKWDGAEDVKLVWKENPYVEFRSMKKARQFLMYGL